MLVISLSPFDRKTDDLTINYSPFYYIDTSVLLENIALVKFIKTTSLNIACEFIDYVISVISLYCFINVNVFLSI